MTFTTRSMHTSISVLKRALRRKKPTRAHSISAFPPNSIAAPPSMQRRTKPRSTALLKARSSIMFPLPRIFPTPPAKLPPEVFFMSPKELLYIDDALGHEQFLIAQCQEAEAALSDPKLKQRVRQLQSAHQQLFNRLMALV